MIAAAVTARIDESLLLQNVPSNLVAIMIKNALKVTIDEDSNLKGSVIFYLLSSKRLWSVEVGLQLAHYWRSDSRVMSEANYFLQSIAGRQIIEKNDGIAKSANKIADQRPRL